MLYIRIVLFSIAMMGSLIGSGIAAPELAVPAPTFSPRPSSDAYVVARDGHFFLGDQRVRVWGINLQSGVFPTYESISQLVDRLSRLGVNGVRLWPTQGTFYDSKGTLNKANMQDGSQLDRYDFFIAELKRKGIFVENPALHYLDNEAIRHWPDPEVNEIISSSVEPDAAQMLPGIAPYISTGWEAMLADHMRKYLAHVNPYTQHDYANEPIFVGWELYNESHFIQCTLQRNCVSKLPPILRDELAQLWKEYLRQTGGDTNRGLPVYDADWEHANSPVHAAYRQFLFERFVSVSQHLESVARSMGKGIAVQPVTYSTQTGDPLLVARAAYSAGDFSTISSYETPLDKNKNSEFFPYRLHLTTPFFYNFNYGAVRGKPTVVYENSFFRPYPYRAEWPWAMLYLAEEQDWDGLFLYQYGQPWAIYTDEAGNEPTYGAKPLPMPSPPGGPHDVYYGLYHGGDEVTTAAWSAAGMTFLGREIATGAQAKIYPFNAAEIFGPAPGYCAPNACGAGGKQLLSELNAASLTEPVRLDLDTGGRQQEWSAAATSTPTGNPALDMTLDRTLPRLLIDTAKSKVVAGILDGDVRFGDGFMLHFPQRQFGFVSIISADGRDLMSSDDIRVYASGKSKNTDFRFDPEAVDFSSATGVVKGIRDAGHAPIIYERLKFTLEHPKVFTRFERFDFNLHSYRTDNGSIPFSINADEPFFTGVITR